MKPPHIYATQPIFTLHYSSFAVVVHLDAIPVVGILSTNNILHPEFHSVIFFRLFNCYYLTGLWSMNSDHWSVAIQFSWSPTHRQFFVCGNECRQVLTHEHIFIFTLIDKRWLKKTQWTRRTKFGNLGAPSSQIIHLQNLNSQSTTNYRWLLALEKQWASGCSLVFVT